MPNYRRYHIGGGTYFFTVVTYDRRPWLCDPWARDALRRAIGSVRAHRPFHIDAWVLLPDHLHCIWTLPEGDGDYSGRWRLIKLMVSKGYAPAEAAPATSSRGKRRERRLWQRRFWEHAIRDEVDFAAHCDYIHYNPVKHGLCRAPSDWPYSTLHRFVRDGAYPADWGAGTPVLDADVGHE